MTARKLLAGSAAVVAVVLSLAPLVSPERTIAVPDHHLDHALLAFLGIVAGLGYANPIADKEAVRWLWPAALAPIVVMFLMAPPLYAIVDAQPWLHAVNHLVLAALAFLTAYAGQRYVRGVGWAAALLLETMAVVAAFGYGVAPAAPAMAAAPVGAPVPPTADAVRGRQVFAKNCAACHGSRGEGGVGPSLIGESSRKDFARAQAWIEHPAPPMPTLYPSVLSSKDVADVAAYVETLK